MDDFFDNFLQVIFSPFGLFYRLPWLALIPSLVFLLLGFHWRAGLQRGGSYARWMPRISAVAWLGYTFWEWCVGLQYPPESVPIRVDLLLIAPLLYFLTMCGAIACWRLKSLAVISQT